MAQNLLITMAKADVLGLSALLTTTMLGMRDVLEALSQAGLRDCVKVIVGGAPVSQRFADLIGADAYVATAPQGVEVVKAWCTGN
jgi:methanogenic corrinoid protein MtbC1